MESKTPAPIDLSVDSVNVHLSYIRRDVDMVNAKLSQMEQALTDKIDEVGNAYVSRVDFNEHLKVDEDHENRIRSLERALWKYVGASSVISAIGSALLLAVIQHYIK